MNTRSSLKSFLSGIALAGAVLFAGSAVAATIPVYGKVSDITENTVILTGDANVTSSKNLAGLTTFTIHFNNVAGRSVMSGVALKAVSDQVVIRTAVGTTSLNFPVTVFPADSDPTDPQAFSATATLSANLDATGAVTGGMSQFTVVLTPVP